MTQVFSLDQKNLELFACLENQMQELQKYFDEAGDNIGRHLGFAELVEKVRPSIRLMIRMKNKFVLQNGEIKKIENMEKQFIHIQKNALRKSIIQVFSEMKDAIQHNCNPSFSYIKNLLQKAKKIDLPINTFEEELRSIEHISDKEEEV